jgi:hypothetical protein
MSGAVFAAMPFAAEFDDVFRYGLESAVHNCGLTCVRSDRDVYSGDVVAWIKQQISGARVVVADLTGENPNVYLEVGYAWGVGVPTVLVCRAGTQLKFDIYTQKCLFYGRIQDLEAKLTRELGVLLEIPGFDAGDGPRSVGRQTRLD